MKKKLLLSSILCATLLNCFVGCNLGMENSSEEELSSSVETSSSVQEETANPYTKGLVFTLNKDGKSYTVSDYMGTETKVVLPSVYNNLPVTEVGRKAFSGCTGITEIIIPEGIISIGKDCFDDCFHLQEISIPNSLRYFDTTSNQWYEEDFYLDIQFNEYENGYYLGNETNPYVALIKVKDTTVSSFHIHNDAKIVNVEFSDWDFENLEYNEYDNAYYVGSENNPYFALVKAKNESISSCSIHNDTIVIGAESFRECKLTEIIIPDKVTTVQSSAFSYCKNITNATLPNSIIFMGWNVFGNCQSLTNITFNGTIEQWKKIIIEGDSSAQKSIVVVCKDGEIIYKVDYPM